jgi:hypothetical protein
MANNSFVLLLKRLREKTDAGELAWTTTGSANDFSTKLPQYNVTLMHRGSDYIVAIYDKNDKVIDSASDTDLKDDFPASYSFMKGLWAAAKRSGTGADQAIRRLLDELT